MKPDSNYRLFTAVGRKKETEDDDGHMVVGGSCRRHLNVRAFRAETVSKNWEEGFQLKTKYTWKISSK